MSKHIVENKELILAEKMSQLFFKTILKCFFDLKGIIYVKF